MVIFILNIFFMTIISIFLYGKLFQPGPFYESNNNIPEKINEIGHLVSNKVGVQSQLFLEKC